MAAPQADQQNRRRRLTEILTDLMERDRAEELAELLLPVPWEEVARRSDIDDLRTELRAEVATLGTDLRTEMVVLGAEVRSEMSFVRRDLSMLQSDVSRELIGMRVEMVALRSQLPKLIAANIASMVGVAGLVLAAGVVL